MGLLPNIFPKADPEDRRSDRLMGFHSGQGNFNAIVNPADEQIRMERDQERNDFLKWQQEFDSDLDNLKHRLRSEVQTDKGWQPQKYLIGYNEEHNDKGEVVRVPVYD